ncbi:hypothetical protein NDU88_005087 [Pleurodeles waltl]|uniref:Uncharacterized protein n=1 Tax=Pleurodeles waltl TaxID=8319 RepID=A0AAV7N3C4_PLEWA|nr:hypothetical protein NDU88_005087 [Pleurodeles waltl]
MSQPARIQRCGGAQEDMYSLCAKSGKLKGASQGKQEKSKSMASRSTHSERGQKWKNPARSRDDAEQPAAKQTIGTATRITMTPMTCKKC